MAQIGPLSMTVFDCQHNTVTIDQTDCLTCDETLEEWLLGEIFVVLFEMLFGWRYELDSSKLEAAGHVNNNAD
jgi:hypothetical protein